MKKIISMCAFVVVVTVIVICVVLHHKYTNPVVIEKPVIYVYNDNTEQKISVKVSKSDLTSINLTYPGKTASWEVVSDPDGNIKYKGREYNYLYWEDSNKINFNAISRGFCVKGEDTAEFLEGALDELGLSEKEANDFITYWLPQMVNNEYNLISFNPPEYEENYKLSTMPAADQKIRVYMVFAPTDTYYDIEPQRLGAYNSNERHGFTVVEWGGSEISNKAFLGFKIL